MRVIPTNFIIGFSINYELEFNSISLKN